MDRKVRDEFAVDENGVTSDGYRRIVPASLRSMYIGRVIGLLISAAVFVPLIVCSDVFEEYADPVRLASMILLAVVAVYMLVSPIVFYRRYRYRLDDEKLEILRGIITIRHILVPVERIHQVEVVRGPINRMFGLSDVVVTTAGGTVKVQFLEDGVAETIADSLNESVIRLLKSRDP